jgi:23S rRNA pseudouridine1911/1915/1917 synthase
MTATIKISSPETHEFWEIPVLHEDEHLLALDKPAGLLVSPDRYDQERLEPEPPNLMQLMHGAIAAGKPWVAERSLTYLTNAHWLDRDTTGVLLLAKSKAVLVALSDLFGTERPIQTQLALVHGAPREEHFEVNAKIGPHPARPGMWSVDPRNGKKTSTRFEVVERFASYTLLKCQLLTNRPHQVRVHLQNSGLRVVGDALYGGAPLLLSDLKSDYRLKPGRTENPLLGRVTLHSELFELPHPVTAAPLTITAPWPKDLRVAIKYLRQYAAA